MVGKNIDFGRSGIRGQIFGGYPRTFLNVCFVIFRIPLVTLEGFFIDVPTYLLQVDHKMPKFKNRTPGRGAWIELDMKEAVKS